MIFYITTYFNLYDYQTMIKNKIKLRILLISIFNIRKKS